MNKHVRPADIARSLAVSQRTVIRMAQAGRIPAKKVGGQWRFDPQAVDLALSRTAPVRLRRPA